MSKPPEHQSAAEKEAAAMKREFYMAVGAIVTLVVGMLAFFLSALTTPPDPKKVSSELFSSTPLPLDAPDFARENASDAAKAVSDAISQVDDSHERRRARKKITSFEPGTEIRESRMYDVEAPSITYDTVDEDALLADADGDSYVSVRRFLDNGRMPPPDTVHIGEMVDHFSYGYFKNAGEEPVSVTVELGDCSWNPGRKIALIAVQAKKTTAYQTPPSNFVILAGGPASADASEELVLMRSALRMLLDELGPRDKISLVGKDGVMLEGVYAGERTRVLDAIESLQFGSAAISDASIQLAYETAGKHFIAKGNNRVILATCGSAADPSEKTASVSEPPRVADVKFSRVHFNNLDEARKALVSQLPRKVVRGVEIQVDFDPLKVKSCRLIGYENRHMDSVDPKGDTQYARDLNDGQITTALYEIEPVGAMEKEDDLLTFKVRYKAPDGDTVRLIAQSVKAGGAPPPSLDLKFASAVAEFGLLLRNSPDKGSATFEDVLKKAEESKGADKDGQRAEFIRLVGTASRILDTAKKQNPS